MSQQLRIGNRYSHDTHGRVVVVNHDHSNQIWFREIIGEDNAGVISVDDSVYSESYETFLGSVSMADYPDNWDQLRQAILTRDNEQCAVCGRSDDVTLQVHHIVPLGMGGTNARSNLITLCNEHHGRVHGGRS